MSHDPTDDAPDESHLQGEPLLTDLFVRPVEGNGVLGDVAVGQDAKTPGKPPPER